MLAVLLLFLIPVGGGIPAGVLLAQSKGIPWPVTAGLYCISDVILALALEPILRLFVFLGSKSERVARFCMNFRLAVIRTLPKVHGAGPIALILIAFGVDPMTGRTAALAAGHGFVAGWAFAIAGDIIGSIYERHNTTRYDSYDRKGPGVYVGEYAAHDQDKKRSTLRTALAEAAGLTGFERNGDVVRFASYAPLLARRGHTQWHPDLIYFDATAVYPTINYHVQRLFGCNAGDTALPAALSGTAPGQRLTCSAVRDSVSGDVIVKVVNGEDRACAVAVALAGVPAGQRRLVATVLAGADADLVNEDGQPPAVQPVTEESAVGACFERVFPANSLTILRLR